MAVRGLLTGLLQLADEGQGLFDDEGFHGVGDPKVERRHEGSFALGEKGRSAGTSVRRSSKKPQQELLRPRVQRREE